MASTEMKRTQIRSIGKLRSMVREMLAEELGEIDCLVREQSCIGWVLSEGKGV